MYKYEPSVMDMVKDKSGVPLSAGYFYGDKYSDNYLFNDCQSLPRFGHLARKALMHYLGDHYNPHRDATLYEPFIRELIKGFIEYRMTHKTTGHDWEFIDNFLKKIISGLYGVPLQYDQQRNDQGILPPYRGILHDLEL